MALVATVKLPTARRPIGNRRVEGALQLAADHDLGDGWSLTLTGESDWLASEQRDSHHSALSLAGSVGRQWSPRWSTALDLLVGHDFDPEAVSTSAQIGLSAAWLATPALQFDIEADAGLSAAAPDKSIQTGLAVRF